jgi:hypothetical protein
MFTVAGLIIGFVAAILMFYNAFPVDLLTKDKNIGELSIKLYYKFKPRKLWLWRLGPFLLGLAFVLQILGICLK